MSEVDSVTVNNASGDENTQVRVTVIVLRYILIRNISGNVHVMFDRF